MRLNTRCSIFPCLWKRWYLCNGGGRIVWTPTTKVQSRHNAASSQSPPVGAQHIQRKQWLRVQAALFLVSPGVRRDSAVGRLSGGAGRDVTADRAERDHLQSRQSPVVQEPLGCRQESGEPRQTREHRRILQVRVSLFFSYPDIYRVSLWWKATVIFNYYLYVKKNKIHLKKFLENSFIVLYFFVLFRLPTLT